MNRHLCVAGTLLSFLVACGPVPEDAGLQDVEPGAALAQGSQALDGCGTLCTQCILDARPDILPFYQANGWDTSCWNHDAIVANWCGPTVDPVACFDLQTTVTCSSYCGGALQLPLQNRSAENNTSGVYGFIANWAPNGGWAYHSDYPRGWRYNLGDKFGFYSAGTTETVGQLLPSRFKTGARYVFQSFANQGLNAGGIIPYQIGYAQYDGDLYSFVPLATSLVNVGGQNGWLRNSGVAYTVPFGSAAVGKQIIVRLGSGASGGYDDIWFDVLTLTEKVQPYSIPLTNPGMETESTPQYGFITGWGPNGAWAYHAQYPRNGNAGLGTRFGYYSAGTTETVGQLLSTRFDPNRAYTFRGYAQGGGDNYGVVPFQIGYAATDGVLSSFTLLASASYTAGADWKLMNGVSYRTPASGGAVGKQIIVRLGSGAYGGQSDIWFDNFQLISSP